MATKVTHCLWVIAFLASPASAAEKGPLSAIDWLSNSVDVDTPEVVAPAVPDAEPPTEIKVMPLDVSVPDTVGLIDASELGVPIDIWGRSSAADLARLLSDLGDMREAPPSLSRFATDLILARMNPPIDAAVDDSFFLARVDRLLAMGHLDAAGDLLLQAGITEPSRFRRLFDIALLTGTETEACQTIEETPELSPTYPARIFCLARLGKWDVAALTLGNAETLGILTPVEDALLLRFLDPELFEDEPVPALPPSPTPLLFRLYEAIGERLQTDQLPVAFAIADVSDTVGWKARLRAAERLTATGAWPFETMLDIYNEREPAASGGVFDRVEAIQALLDALDRKDGAAVAQALHTAWNAAREAGYEASFAIWLTDHFDGLSLPGGVHHLAFEIALLGGRTDQAAKFADQTQEDQFLLALSQGRRGVRPGSDPLARAVVRGLSALGPGMAYETLIQDDRRGEALFRAVTQLSEAAAGNPDATARSLALLRVLGLEELARQVAVELVLMEGSA